MISAEHTLHHLLVEFCIQVIWYNGLKCHHYTMEFVCKVFEDRWVWQTPCFRDSYGGG